METLKNTDMTLALKDGSPIILTRNTDYSTNLHNSTSLQCTTNSSSNITWYHDNHTVQSSAYYTISSDDKMSMLIVKDINCQQAGNYTCVATNKYGSDQRQFTITIFDLPRPPSNLVVDPQTKQITWKNVPGYKCLPESHFVVQYKKYSSTKWNNAGYFDNRTFDLKNATKGEKYHVQIYAINVVGKSQIKSVVFWTNIKPTDTYLEVNGTAVQDAQKIFVSKRQRVRVRCLVTAEPKPRFVWRIPGSVFKLIFYRNLLVSGIKWQASLGINSMSCSLSGTYSCMPYNALGYGSRPTITFEVLEPDPPKTFVVVFANITTVQISWSADKCNGIRKPSSLFVRYRKEGYSAWIEDHYNNPPQSIFLTGKFQYETVYEFSSRLGYKNRIGVYSRPLKLRSPGKVIKFRGQLLSF
ncbi:unnamed protein product [Porites evermanni]|uniref:Uncharacterized protein n=1 Tax=Porites evermanni TaxID=104178 RepID=A0ABN8LUU6_9CNID|nr:unnamed protein product [Porites evermanni]